MPAWALMVVLAQLPDAGAPLSAPIPPPLSPQPAAPVAEAEAEPSPGSSPSRQATAAVAAEPAPGPVLRLGVESGLTSWPMGHPQDLWLFARPLLAFDSGENFAVEAGATFNLVVVDEAPGERSVDGGGVLHLADWDEPSDFGQIVRLVRLGHEGGRAWAKAGPMRLKTLGHGHLLSRYSNQDVPDYHPASANAGLHLGPLRAELLASDIFAARLFAGLLGLDLGRLFGGEPTWHERFWLQLEAAHDEGAAGGPTLADLSRLRSPAASFLYADASAVLYRSAGAVLQAVLGMGARVGPRPELGAALALTADLDLGGFLLGGKLEGRRQGGGFRHGYFGPQYELSRFVGAGFSGLPLAQQVLPDAFSVYAELRAGGRGVWVTELSVEHFFWGRTDLDASLQAELFGSRLVASARFTAVALGVFPRYAVGADLRLRLFRSFYVLGAGGTLFFPKADGTLTRGVFVTAGVGLDIEAGIGK